MTELERARAHLLDCQTWLARLRRNFSLFEGAVNRAELDVLAALSWVWEEQDRIDGDYVFPRVAGDKDFGFERP